jgi:hypothetical protein
MSLSFQFNLLILSDSGADPTSSTPTSYFTNKLTDTVAIPSETVAEMPTSPDGMTRKCIPLNFQFVQF